MQRKCKRHATLLLLVGALVLGSAVGDGEAKTTTSDVLVLTDASLDEAVGKASHLLLEFYAPWCGRCQEVAPAFEEAATELKRVRSVVQLAKIDITENPKSVKRFEVASFPTFKWFVGGKLTGAKPATTDASRTAESMVDWCQRHADPPRVITSAEELDAAIEKASPLITVGFFDTDPSGPLYEAFLQGAEAEVALSFPFVTVTDSAVAAARGVQVPSVVFFSKAENPQGIETAYTGPMEGEALAEAAKNAGTPELLVLDEDNGDSLFEHTEHHKVILLFPDETAEKAVRSVSKKLKGRYDFVMVKRGTNKHLDKWIGMTLQAGPQIFVTKIRSETRFHFQGEMEADAIAEWLGKYSEDDVEEYFISQALPADWDAKELKVVTGSSFAAFSKQDAHVVVMFCVPPKPACREAAQKLGKIAEYFALLDPEERVVFGQLDLQKNQVPHNDVKEAPTIWMWPRGKKEPPYPIDLTAELAEPRAMVSQIKKAAGITASKARLNEDAYVAAAKRFKAAVRALQGDVQPAVDALLLAAEHLEASQAGQ